MSNATHRIEVSFDNPEAEQFVAWLNANGHDAKVGRSTGNYVDGNWTSSDLDASQIMNALWDSYCNA